ncbi:hypothetical protein NQ315_003374 [Exocentrus adspersus]|uniref:YqaJ viral recombinase domain-containing protein n=1 Tax=Exocentrus adspersus TaxID=1586481 RepID=A0AAV8VAT3_9CUCU|nr:hypothetical protein NQ315_003374 [Exocentrus adspersus]
MKKIEIINGIDPYTLDRDRVKASLDSVPDVTIMDMVNYLILSRSFYTGQQMKAYKSLQAYKFYEAGFVQDVFGEKINENACVVIGKVRPEFGASPDALIKCDCCGMGCIEIKCPYLLLNMIFEEFIDKKILALYEMMMF